MSYHKTSNYKIKAWIALSANICLAWSAFGQTNTQGVGDEQVVVVKQYEAKIQDAQKIDIPPDIPETAEKPLTFDYLIPTKDYSDFNFTPNPLRPIALNKEKLEKFNSSYIKLGFGSQLTPLAQLAYNDNKTKDLKFGIFYNHLSSRGFKIKNQRFVDDEAGAYLRYYPKTLETGASFTFHNYRTHFYSTDTSFADTSFTPKQVRQVFRNYDAQVFIGNAQKKKYDINFRQDLRFNYLQETYGGAKEWFMSGTTTFSKTFKQYHSALADFNFDISQLKHDSITLQRNLFRFAIGYGFNNADWQAQGKIGLAVDGKKVYLIADAYVQKLLYQHAIVVYLGYHLRYDKNSLFTFAQENPYIQNNVLFQNEQIGDFGAGLKGSVSGFSYNAGFHVKHINQMPLFVNDSNDMRRFITIYDTHVKIFQAHFEAGYQVKEWLRFSLSGDYRFYQMNHELRAWQQPALLATFRAQYIWKNKIKVGIELFGITNSYAKLTGGREALLKGTGDLNLSLEYYMNKHISFFGYLNNIAHQRYQKWYGYPSFGINGVIGAKFSF